MTYIPDHLDFQVAFEPTKMHDKKYVLNNETGEYLGIVGKSFQCASHGDFFRGVMDTATQELGAESLEDAEHTFKTARNGAWAMLDVTLPNIKTTITTDKAQTEIGNRIISLHGIDGSCSNQVFFGAIDFFCTNGMITGDHDKVRKKNTSNFTMDSFIYELNRARTDFFQQAAKMQVWAETSLKFINVKDLLDSIISSKTKAEKMFGLYNAEANVRGHNKFSLYSAFTNYASYADERNGFSLRNTGHDTQAISMWSREQEVSKWVSSKQFDVLEAA
tara:strand:+ start:3560 stop:4387 length:828 start_codon:yes stop_codon:yes gene_type:complete